jgi:glutathione synthase/RimK-type ligase-like ATP-grasp enzyme
MIGIHHRPGSFSDRWIEYCQERSIDFRLLDCLSSDVVPVALSCDAVLWHWSMNDLASMTIAKQIVAALEIAGVPVYPNVASSWHYDDKIAQKFLLEAIGAPTIPTWLFTDKTTAMQWIAGAAWPKVFKLRCGAGATNVRLVRSRVEAERLCRRAFSGGFAGKPGHFNDLANRMRKTKNSRHFVERLLRAPSAFFKRSSAQRQFPRETGYVYFQEFLSRNEFDTRVVIIGNKAFAFRRFNRPSDFRASGSNLLSFEPERIDLRAINVALNISKQLGTQSLAFDFLTNEAGEPVVVEMSYCFRGAMRYCPGHWDDHLVWHEGSHRHEDLILEDLLANVTDESGPGALATNL